MELHFLKRKETMLIAMGTLLLASCGGGGGSTSSELVANGSKPLSGQPDSASPRSSITEHDTAELVNQISAAETPAGVDSELYAKLTAELIRVLEARGLERITASLPDPEKSRVTDLAVSGDSSLATFTWSYSNPADYDQNGEVNIADLTPVGVHFGKDSNSPDWATASIADGDGNGLVNLADITPIGQNYLNRISGFELQLGDSAAATEWTLAADVDVSAGSVSSGRRSFSHDISAASEGFYRALPYENGNPRSLGEAGNVVQLIGSNPLPSEFSETGGGPGRTNAVGILGPDSTPGSETTNSFGLEFFEALVGQDQNVYSVTKGRRAVRMLPDGTVDWDYPLAGVFQSQFLSGDDELIVTDRDGELVHLSSSGNLLNSFGTGERLSIHGITSNGLYILYSPSDYTVYAYNANGSMAWQFGTEGRRNGKPEVLASGRIYVPSWLDGVPSFDPADCRLHALDNAGQQFWEFSADAEDGSGGEVKAGPADSAYFFTGITFLYKVDADGNRLWKDDTHIGSSFDVHSDGSVALGGNQNVPVDSFWILDADGEELFGTTSPGDVSIFRFGQNGRLFFRDVFEGIKSYPNGGPGDYWNLPELGSFSGNGDASGNLYNGGGLMRKVSPGGEILWSVGETVDIRVVPVFSLDGSMLINFGRRIGSVTPSGSERWSYSGKPYMDGQLELASKIDGSPLIREDGSILLAQGSRVYTEAEEWEAQGYITALDPAGGELWSFHDPSLAATEPVSASDGGAYFIADDGINRNAVLISIDDSGMEEWRRELMTTEIPHEIAAQHGAESDMIFVAYETAAGKLVSAISSDNDLLWTYIYTEISTAVESICSTGDGGCLVVFPQNLIKLDADGNEDWNISYPGGSSFTDQWFWAAVLPNGDIIASYEWYLTRLDKDGNELWTSTVSQEEGSNKWFSEFIVDGSGRTYGPVSNVGVRCFNPDGTEAWVRDLPGITTICSPVLSPDGSVVAISGDLRDVVLLH